MSGAYQGEAKTDARDAYVIAETSRHRRDFTAIDGLAQLAADLALLTAHRSDPVANRVRMINRLCDVLTGVFPALERAFDYSAHRGAPVLLTGYQSPAAIGRRGRPRLTAWLANHSARGADAVAATPLDAAGTQQGGLGLAATAAARSKDTYLASRCKRIAVRRGKKRAMVAVGHILTSAWHMLTRDADYHGLGGDYFIQRTGRTRQTRRLVSQLNTLGYQVSLQSTEAV